MSHIERLWKENENLLQAYRIMFILSQSMLLVAGAVLWDKSSPVLSAMAVVCVGIIWMLWVPIVFARHRTIDYCKHAAALDEAQRSALCCLADYLADRDQRRKANAVLGIRGNLGITRCKIDVALPCCLTFLWLLLVISAWMHHGVPA